MPSEVAKLTPELPEPEMLRLEPFLWTGSFSGATRSWIHPNSDCLKAIHSVHGKVPVIADRAPSRQSKKTTEFVENHKGIELEYIPRGSPCLNGVEEWRQTKHDQQNSEYYESMKGTKKAVSKHLRTKLFNLSVLKYLKRSPPKQKIIGWKTG